MYSDAVRTRFMQPQFAGSLSGEAVLRVTVGAQEQGAVIALDVVVDAIEPRITAARFKAYGCGACIATADYLCESLIGLSQDQLEHMDTQNIASALELASVKLAWRQAEASLMH